MWFLLLTPIIESALLKTWLKVERFSLEFMNLNLLRTKRKEDWTFWGSPFSVTIWLVYVIVCWLDQGPNTQYLLWNINYNFRFKIQPVDQIFFQVKKTFLVRCVRHDLAFLMHLVAYAWIQDTGLLLKLRVAGYMQTVGGELYS